MSSLRAASSFFFAAKRLFKACGAKELRQGR